MIVVLHDFLTEDALQRCIQDARKEENDAYTTDDTHTPYLTSIDTTKYPINSIYNHEMRTRVASIAYDELPPDSPLVLLYQHPLVLPFISEITSNQRLFLSEDPIGACSINVFRPNYYHSFHFDESEFSTTIMIQEAETGGLFQYTPPLRQSRNDLALSKVATTIHTHATDTNHKGTKKDSFLEQPSSGVHCPELHTLDFRPGTLSIFSGSKSLHRVTQVKGSKSRLVAVLTFATQPGFKNSKQVQELFWGRSSN